MKYATLLILPLLGGYWYCKHWYKTAYELTRESDQLIYFKSASYGVFLLFASFSIYFSSSLIIFLFSECNISALNCSINPISKAFKYTSGAFSESPNKSIVLIYIGSFVLGYCLPTIKSYFLKRRVRIKIQDSRSSWIQEFNNNHAVSESIEDEEDNVEYLKDYYLSKKTALVEKEHLRKLFQNNDFELLVLDAYLREIPICITLNNNKVYIGMVLSEPNPELKRRSIKLLPFASGYRDESEVMQITTNYFTSLERIADPKEKGKYLVDEVSDFQKIIRADEKKKP